MKSVFLKKQGESPKNKLLDFLIVHAELDYSLKELSIYSGAGYSSVKLLIKKLLKDKWVKVTRKISKIKLYKLNISNPEVMKFIEFYWAVVEQEVRGGDKVDAKQDLGYSPSVSALPVSARNI